MVVIIVDEDDYLVSMSGRLLMMDVDDDGFKIYTASRLNKARGLTKGRAAPCNEVAK